jgi:hypothetical protein
MRSAIEVVSLLKCRMDDVVRDYNDADPQGVQRVDEPIHGTAFFPGGHGLWRGLEPHGPLPERFPENAVMVVGHNFDSVRGYRLSLERGIELVKNPTWAKLREYLAFADQSLEQCFFTNALMGLQPEKSRGPLKTTDRFRSECRLFLGEQITIVHPIAIVALGAVASADLEDIQAEVPMIAMMHPYAAIRAPGLAQRRACGLSTFSASNLQRSERC